MQRLRGRRTIASMLLRREDGFALLLALGLCVVLSIVVVGMIQYTTSTSHSASLSQARTSSQSLAESGIGEAASILNHAANASSPTLLGCSVSPLNVNNSAPPCTDIAVPVQGGTAYFHGLYTQGVQTGTWTILSYGDVPSPLAGAPDQRMTMTATITITGGGQQNNISVWNYLYSTAPQAAGCEVNINGNNVVVDVPIYVTGDLCVSGNNAAIMENTADGGQKVDVQAQGKVVINGANAHIGSAGAPITSGVAAQGCTNAIGNSGHTCTAADKWYVKQTDTPLAATPPATDYPGEYAGASPGPDHSCDPVLTPAPNLTAAGNNPHAFDNDGTMNGGNGQFNLTPGSDYNCVTSSGSLSWNHTTHVLAATGTIFFDGNLTSSDTAAMYHGLATLYVDGEFVLTGNNASLKAGCPASPAVPTHQCAFANSSPEWNPNKDMLIVVTNKANGTSVDMSGNNVVFQGGLMCTPTSTANLAGNNVQMEGPIICGRFAWGNNTTIDPLPTITSLPPGAPVPPNAPATISPPTITGS